MTRLDWFLSAACRLVCASLLIALAHDCVAQTQPDAGAVGLPELKQLVAAKLPAHLSLSSVAIDKMEQKGNPQMQLTTGTLLVVATIKDDLYVAQGSEGGKTSLYLSERQGEELRLQANVVAVTPAAGLGKRTVNVILGVPSVSTAGRPLSFYPEGSYAIARDEAGAPRRLAAGATVASAEPRARTSRSARARELRGQPAADAAPSAGDEGNKVAGLAPERPPEAPAKPPSATAAAAPAPQQTASAAALEARQAQIRKGDAAGTETHFPEAVLLGSWRGEFVDGASVVSAELVLWSGTSYGFRKLGGYLSFLDRPCTTFIVINQDRSTHYFSLSTEPVVSAQPNCERGSRGHAVGFGTGTVEMAKDGSSLSLYADPFTGLDGRGSSKCLSGLARAGCWQVGRFVHAPLSDTARTWVAGAPPKEFTAPTAEMLSMLASGRAASPSMQAEHAAQAAKNESVVAAKRAEQDRAAEESRQKDAAYRQRVRAQQTAQAAAVRSGVNLASQSGPFNGLDGATYLNALYNGDTSELRRQDMEYALAVQRSRADFVGKKDAKTQPLDAEHRKMTLSNIVYTTYLNAYGTTYRDCLREGAMKFTSSRVTQGSVSRNKYGVELWRTQGTVTENDALVNAEFVDIYKRIYNSEWANLADALLDRAVGGPKSALIRGTRDLMALHKCDSPVIKTLETNMQAVFGALHP